MRRAALLGTIALALALAAGVLPGSGRPARPAPAPPASIYVSTTGSDAGPCTKSRPCHSLDRAYRAARPGQVVEVAAGSYDDEEIRLDPAKTSPRDVVVRPARSATVRLTKEVFVYARHLELRGLTMQYRIHSTAQDVTMRNIRVPGRFVVVSDGDVGPRDIRIIGGDVGPSVDANVVIGSNGYETPASPRNVLIDGVTFHDFTLAPGSDAHVECLQVWAADGLTIRNSRFRNCWVFDIFVSKGDGFPAATPSNILIENDFLDCCGGGDNYSLRLSDSYGGTWKNVTIRNNSSNQKFSIGPGTTYDRVAVLANIAPLVDGTPSGVKFAYNVWYAGRAVGAGDRVAPAGYRDPARLDFHLRPGAAAIGHGDPSSYPRTDIDGQRRPIGSGPDAGADERR